MPHELRLVLEESTGAEDVIGMNVRHEHVSDWQVGDLANSRTQPLTIFQTATRIHDRDTLASDDEADVRDRVEVLGASRLMYAPPNVNPRRNLLGRQLRF